MAATRGSTLCWGSLEGVGSWGPQGLLFKYRPTWGHSSLPTIPKTRLVCMDSFQILHVPSQASPHTPQKSPPHHPTAGCPRCSLSIRIPLSQQISRSECTEHEYFLLPLLLLGPMAPSSHCLRSCLGCLVRLPLGAPPLGAELGSSGGEGWKGRSGEVRGQFCVPTSLRQIAPAKPLRISSLPDGACVGGFLWRFPSLLLSP